jgi:hypothetical protein
MVNKWMVFTLLIVPFGFSQASAPPLRIFVECTAEPGAKVVPLRPDQVADVTASSIYRTYQSFRKMSRVTSPYQIPKVITDSFKKATPEQIHQ